MRDAARRKGAPFARHIRVLVKRGVWLLVPMRGRTDTVPADAWLQVGTRRVNLDRLPPSLARLVPMSYGNATPEQWAPFLAALEVS